MEQSGFLNRLMRLLAALALGSACLSAQATAYVGSWDPQFALSGDFSNLGYQGKAFFDVPDSCLASEGLSDGACGSSFLSGFVQLYNFSAGPSPILATANFGPQANAVTDVFITSGEVTGIATGPIGPQFVASSLFTGFAWLQFSINTDVVATPGRVDLFLSPCRTSFVLVSSDIRCLPNFSSAIKSDIQGIVTFTRVPEPGTLSLLFGALSALAWLQRRRLARG